MTAAEIVGLVHLGFTVIGGIVLLWQNHILKQRIEHQKGIIEDLKTFKEIVDIAYIKEFVALRVDTITEKTEAEKRKMKEEFLKELGELQSTTSSQQEAMQRLKTMVYELADFSARLGGGLFKDAFIIEVAKKRMTADSSDIFEFSLSQFRKNHPDVVPIIETISEISKNATTTTPESSNPQ
jgi:hypothetical protein